MIDYLFYIYVAASAVSCVVMLKFGVSFWKTLNSSLMFCLSYWIWKTFPSVYFWSGFVISFLISLVTSFSEPFRSKSNFFKDLKDVIVTVAIVAASAAFWMQVLLLNIYVEEARNSKSR